MRLLSITRATATATSASRCRLKTMRSLNAERVLLADQRAAPAGDVTSAELSGAEEWERDIDAHGSRATACRRGSAGPTAHTNSPTSKVGLSGVSCPDLLPFHKTESCTLPEILRHFQPTPNRPLSCGEASRRSKLLRFKNRGSITPSFSPPLQEIFMGGVVHDGSTCCAVSYRTAFGIYCKNAHARVVRSPQEIQRERSQLVTNTILSLRSI